MTDSLSRLPSHLFNREISWFAFNNRVLDEAFNTAHPLLERLNFLAISASNLDEFYMVRFSHLRTRILKQDDALSFDGLTAQEEMAAINKELVPIVARQQKCWQDLRKELAAQGICVVRPAELTKADTTWLQDFFRKNVLPLLTPIAVDPAHPFPLIPNKGVALVLGTQAQATGEQSYHLIPVPAKIDRFIKIMAPPEEHAHMRFMLLDQIILLFADDLIPGFSIKDSGVFRVIRNTELEFSQGDDFLKTFEHTLQKRRYGHVIRLGIHRDTPENLRLFLREETGADESDTYIVNGMNGLCDLKELVGAPRPDLRYPPYEARLPERLNDYNNDIFAAIKAKDILVHHPYESFDVVVHFLRQAAADPDVLTIKQTLYRTSANSPIVAALKDAALAGKNVTVTIELKARFDEEANIKWARDLERAGAHVVYGFVDLKTHAKISMVVRREGQSLTTYTHFGTGNYHPQTARVYTDLSLFSCDGALARDTAALFNYMTGYAEPKPMEKLSYAPQTLRRTLYALIDAEIQHAKAGRPATLWAKMNALVDEGMIEKLYEASQAGVQIHLIVRGVCCLMPDMPGLSEHIHVRSIVGRHLEHARIICFGDGHALPSPQAKVFITSADWMPRNLDRRIEVMVPIENPTVHEQIVSQIMLANLKDNTQSWQLSASGAYARNAPGPGEEAFSAHDYFMKNPSLSGRGSALLGGHKPPALRLKKGL